MKTDPNLDAAAVVVRIVLGHPEVAAVCVFEAAPAPLVQERGEHPDETNRVVSTALQLKAEYGLPFWDGALLSCVDLSPTPIAILRAASHHNRAEYSQLKIEKSNLSAELLRQMASAAQPGTLLAVSSRLDMEDASERHIPMLDFHCAASPTNLRLIEAVIRRIGISGGFILQSGKSYHFYGEKLLTKDDLIRFLGNALLFAPIVDRAWVAHQLIELACGLRISSRASGPPQVVRLVGL